ncbi:MAG: hypothetical protein IJW67_08060 [Blautia sp.]|nr:hypothetical protein [Blautia sp.]
MKEQLHTIPLIDAFRENDECPFCFVERKLEEHTLDFVLGPGASYMEPDVREATDAAGFCRVHYKKLFDYGNRLGTGLILKTHFKKLNEELNEQIKMFAPSHVSVFSKLGIGKKQRSGSDTSHTSLGAWAVSKEESCYICNFYKENFQRYLDTFFEMYRNDAEFQKVFREGKGFCLPHFGALVDAAETTLSDKEKPEFYQILLPLIQDNMKRLYNDLDWFCDKFDYRNKDADWKTSKDAIPRGMQKAAGGYPDLPPYTSDR